MKLTKEEIDVIIQLAGEDKHIKTNPSLEFEIEHNKLMDNIIKKLTFIKMNL